MKGTISIVLDTIKMKRNSPTMTSTMKMEWATHVVADTILMG